MERIQFKRDYIFKVWGSTIVTAPILTMLLTALIVAKNNGSTDIGFIGFITLSIGYGILFSIPALLIIWALFFLVNKVVTKPGLFKLIFAIIGILCILLTFYFLFGSEAYDLKASYAALTFSINYSICLVVFSFIFPLRKKMHCL